MSKQEPKLTAFNVQLIQTVTSFAYVTVLAEDEDEAKEVAANIDIQDGDKWNLANISQEVVENTVEENEDPVEEILGLYNQSGHLIQS